MSQSSANAIEIASARASANVNNVKSRKGTSRIIKANLSFKQKSRIRNRARITPWCNSSEFDYVGKCLSNACQLFPYVSSNPKDTSGSNSVASLDSQGNKITVEKEDQDKCKDEEEHEDKNDNNKNELIPLNDEQFNELVYGIGRVNHWRKRSGNGRLPHSVDMSGSIATLLLQDTQKEFAERYESRHQNDDSMLNSISNSYSLKLSYASTIIRAVNGIADSIQKNRATYGSSVSQLCTQIGLPGWIVDLRHDAAHNELPSLVPMRLACKTLLGFFMEKYWTVLEDFRTGWWMNGERLLTECKGALKALDRVDQKTDDKAEVDIISAENDDDDDDGDDAEEGGGNNYGAYSIFMEDGRAAASANSSIKKKKNKQSTPKTTPKPKPPGRTPRKCLNDFVKTVPMDVGLNMTIQYLIYGGIGDAPEGRGILIPGSPSTFPEHMSSVRKIRERYSVILLFMASKWPGFIHALFLNLVEAIICLDERFPRLDTPSTNANTCNENVEIDEAEVDAQMAGKKRKIYFLKHWIHYLLSNDFYCFLQWHDITWKGSKNIRQRPRDKWTEDLLLHMEASAPLDILKRVRIPLNSICDRLLVEGADVCQEMVKVLEGILGKDRWATSSTKRQMDDFDPTSETLNAKRYRAQLDNGSRSSKEESGLLSLDEMEDMLSDKEKVKDNKSINIVECADTNIDSVRPWTLCQSWEPCAIGNLPGFA